MTGTTLRILRQELLGFPGDLLHGCLITVKSEIWSSSYQELVFTLAFYF